MENGSCTPVLDVILRGGVVVNQNGHVSCDLGIKDGRVAAMGNLGSVRSIQSVDCRGLHILPGVIDTHVHFREPGATHKEDFETGSRAAILGGVTTIFDMPNTSPQTTDSVTLAEKYTLAKGRIYCDFAFFLGATKQNINLLSEMEWDEACCGVKLFMGSSTGNMLVDASQDVKKILQTVRRPVACHAEDEEMLRERAGLRVPGDPKTHTKWRSDEVAFSCTKRLLGIARETGKKVHLLHVSTAQEMSLLAENRDIASVEVTPHHLTLLADEAYERLGSCAQINPPLRDAAHQRMLWAGINDGLVDSLGSDHAPHTLDEKNRSYPDSPSGMPGVQSLVPIMLTHVAAGRLSLERFVDLTSAGPARLYGIACKGRIARGYDADLTIVDLKRRERLSNRWSASKCGWTAFDGMEVTGWPVGVYLRGKPIMWESEIADTPTGEAVRFMR